MDDLSLNWMITALVVLLVVSGFFPSPRPA